MKKIIFIAVLFVGLICSARLHAIDFTGAWMGNSAGWSFQLKIWSVNGEWNGRLQTDNVYENLVFLGYDTEEDALYFYRPAQKACLTVYSDGKLVFLSYFKKDEADRIMLMKI